MSASCLVLLDPEINVWQRNVDFKCQPRRNAGLGSPVYVGSMAVLMKTFFDRHNGVAVFNPNGAPEFHRLGLVDTLRTLCREVKRFGPRYESMRGTAYVPVTASTLSCPFTFLTGQTRLALSALGALPRRFDGRVLARIISTDSPVRCLEGKEAQMMRRTYRVGQRIVRHASV